MYCSLSKDYELQQHDIAQSLVPNAEPESLAVKQIC